VRDDHRQRIFVLGTNVNEVDVEPVDLSHEIRQGVDPRLHLAPVVLARPIAREPASSPLHALRRIGDRFPLRAISRLDAPAQSVSCASENRCETGESRSCRGLLAAFCRNACFEVVMV